MGNINDSTSVLRLLSLYVDEMSYKKLAGQVFDQSADFDFIRNIEEIDIDKHKVSLTIKIEKTNEYSIFIKMSGVFEISSEIEAKDILLKKNTVAILFPYIRSQLTLLTSQPNMQPIIIPPINILALLKDE